VTPGSGGGSHNNVSNLRFSPKRTIRRPLPRHATESLTHFLPSKNVQCHNTGNMGEKCRSGFCVEISGNDIWDLWTKKNWNGFWPLRILYFRNQLSPFGCRRENSFRSDCFLSSSSSKSWGIRGSGSDGGEVRLWLPFRCAYYLLQQGNSGTVELIQHNQSSFSISLLSPETTRTRTGARPQVGLTTPSFIIRKTPGMDSSSTQPNSLTSLPVSPCPLDQNTFHFTSPKI